MILIKKSHATLVKISKIFIKDDNFNNLTKKIIILILLKVIKFFTNHLIKQYILLFVLKTI